MVNVSLAVNFASMGVAFKLLRMRIAAIEHSGVEELQNRGPALASKRRPSSLGKESSFQ